MTSSSTASEDRSLWKLVLASVVIRRPEFLVAEIPIIAIPTFLAAAGTDFTVDRFYLLGVLLFLLLFHFGDMINCLFDRDLDSKYKKHLSRAVFRLGVNNVQVQLVITTLAALVLTAFLSLSLGRWMMIPLVIVGLVMGAQYSAGPIHFKRRGLWHLVCLWGIIFVGPMLLISQLVTPFPSSQLLWVICLYGGLQMGTILINTAEDYPEDVEAGMRNTIVALGLNRGITFSATLISLFGLGFMATFYQLLTPLSVPEAVCMVVNGSTILVVAVSAWRLSLSIRNLKIEDAVVRVKKDAKLVPLWLTLIAWSSLGLAWLYYRQGP